MSHHVSLPSARIDPGKAPMLCSLFVRPSTVARYLEAPMLPEREAYISHLVSLGRTSKLVHEAAVAIFHAQRLRQWTATKAVSEEELARLAAKRLDEMQRDPRLPPDISSARFICTVRSWLRFLGLYTEPDRGFGPFKLHFTQFLEAMAGEYGYLPSSVRAFRYMLEHFLIWAGTRRELVLDITLQDIDQYIAEKRAAGRRPRTVHGLCRALRRFFKYAEHRGWSDRTLSRTVKAPPCYRATTPPFGPSWKQVRRRIRLLDDSIPSHCRAKAVLLLASVYGLRTCEIARLELEDLDWFNEVLTVRRAKRGRVQQFPIQYEVGEAIIKYLRGVRPACQCRNVFISLTTPYRNMDNLGPAMRKFLNAPGILEPPCGLHALRHACATELLRQGTSLCGIADFLGHRGLRSVSIYARSDVSALRKVADLSLKAVL